ncbi:MAG: hypothetical protein ABI776_08545 [Nocardioidaceae bacterium]
MFVLGLILILLAAGAVVAVVASGTHDQAVMYGGNLHLPTLVVFLAGAATLLVLLLGLALMRTGLRKAHQNRKNSKRLRRLEKREEQRQASTPTNGPAATGPADTGPAATGPGASGPGPAAASEPARRDGPYQTPPPAR